MKNLKLIPLCLAIVMLALVSCEKEPIVNELQLRKGPQVVQTAPEPSNTPCITCDATPDTNFFAVDYSGTYGPLRVQVSNFGPNPICELCIYTYTFINTEDCTTIIFSDLDIYATTGFFQLPSCGNWKLTVFNDTDNIEEATLCFRVSNLSC